MGWWMGWAEPEEIENPPEEQWSWRQVWVLVWRQRLWIALAVLFALVWWLVPPLLYRHTGAGQDARLKAITDTRTALLAGLVGVGALLTFWLNSRIYRITAQTLETTERGQITERYTKAIEQLGSDQLNVRLGGIYALESIAHDSDEDRGYREHRTIVEVLSAFVREAAAERRPDVEQPDRKAKPPADVKAALTVLGRLPHRPNVSRADLSEIRWADMDLQRAPLAGFRLIDADLQGADLTGARLQDATRWVANLSGAILADANLWKADLSGANLTGANLTNANLAGVNLGGAILQGTDFSGANLAGVRQANLDAAILDAVAVMSMDRKLST